MRGVSGQVFDFLVNLPGVVEALQGERVLAQAVDTEERGGAAQPEQEGVVVDVVAGVEFDRLALRIDTGDTVLRELAPLWQ